MSNGNDDWLQACCPAALIPFVFVVGGTLLHIAQAVGWA